MLYINLLISFLFYAFVVLALNYYISLFLTKDQFTKEELKNIKPFFTHIWTVMTTMYPASAFLAAFISSSIVGIIFPRIIIYWLFSSILPFALVYISFPYISKHFQETKVAESEGLKDKFANIFIKYQQIFVFGFGLGSLASFSVNWLSDPKMYSFLLFAANIAGSIILLQYTLNSIAKKA